MLYSHLKTVYEFLINLVNTYPDLPDMVKEIGIQIGETSDGRKTAMSLNVNLNNSESKTYVCGGKSLVFDCEMYYQAAAQTNEAKLKSLNLLSKIGLWLEGDPVVCADGKTYQIDDYSLDGITNIKVHRDAVLTKKGVNGLNVFSLFFKTAYRC